MMIPLPHGLGQPPGVEYLAEFRTDVEGFVALEVVESCVGGYREMLPAAGVTYCAFVDPSGGSE